MGFLSEEGFLDNSKSIFSSLCGNILRASSLTSPMQIPKHPIHQNHHLVGLKTLVHSQEEQEPSQNPSHSPFISHSYIISPSPSSSSSSSPSSSSPLLFRYLTHSSSWSSVPDDWIGTESGAYKSSSEEEILEVERTEIHTHHSGKRKFSMTREYPPTIPLLARTGNLSGHMPWVLTRHYSDGKLVLNLVRVKHHEYFEAYRENGRLMLNLVPLDDTITSCQSVDEKKEEVEELQDIEFIEEEKEINGHMEEENVEDYQESKVDDDDGGDSCIDIEVVDGIEHEGSMEIAASSMPKSGVENGSERCGDVRNFFCNANTHEHGSPYQSGSPLAFSIRPMTTVM